LKRIGAVLLLLAVLLALLTGALAVLTATPGGFGWLTRTLTSMTQGRVKLEGVAGDLFGPLSIRRIEVLTDSTRITVENARLQWQARDLLHGRLDIGLLAARRVTLDILKKSPEPLSPPPTLRLPFVLNIGQLDVAEIVLRDPLGALILRDARLRVTDEGAGYRLQLTSLSTPKAWVRGQVQLNKDAPFAVRGGFQAQASLPAPVMARLTLQGMLAAIRARIEAHAEGMDFAASGDVAPFAEVMLTRLVVAGRGIDPGRLHPGAPRANLAFSGVFEGRPGERLLGAFSLANSRAGRLDEGRLPLVNLRGAVLGDPEQADFTALELDLGPAGRFGGDGEWRAGQYRLNLDSPQMNLAGLHRSLYPTRIKGAFQLVGNAARQRFSGQLAEGDRQGRFSVDYEAGLFKLTELDFSSRGAKLNASGRLNLAGRRDFAAQFNLAGLNPAHFGRFPSARLMARGEVEGRLQPELFLRTRFELPDGELEGRPLRGRGRLSYERGSLRDAEVDLNLADNLIWLGGNYGRPGDKLVWSVNAPALGRLGLGFSGRLSSRGTLSGSLAQPRVDLAADAQALRLPGVGEAENLSLKLELRAPADGALHGELIGQDLLLAGQKIASARVSVQGRRSAHEIAIETRLADWNGDARLQGGLDADGLWRGRIESLNAQGPWPLTLLAPARLLVSRASQTLENAQFSLMGGRIELGMLSLRDNTFTSRGGAQNFPAAPLLALMSAPPAVSTDLRLAGNWDLRLAETLEGSLNLRRQSGDVRYSDSGLNLDLGLQLLTLDLQSEAGQVNARLEANTAQAGRIGARGQARVVRQDWRVMLPDTTPVDFTVLAEVPDLRLLRASLPLGVKADARLKLDLKGSGTLARPILEGQMQADAIRLAMAEEGIHIRDGALKLILEQDKLTLSDGLLHGKDGRIRVQGMASLREPEAELTLVFERFAALTRSDRQVWLSGTTRLDFAQKRLLLEGKLRADKARVAMPEAGRPELSSDVIIVGRSERPVAASRRFPIHLNLELDLGDDFRFKGAGLDSRLGGQIRLLSSGGRLQATGAIKIREGKYAAYGQELDIERGVLSFSGPPDNPGLDILALRKSAEVTVGVRVAGTVQRPRVSLYSDPAMPDTEKLSWLVLGQSLQNADRQQVVTLQAAAGALLSLSDSASLQAGLAETLHIDSIAVRAGSKEDLSDSVISVGKRLSSGASISFEQSLDGLSQVVKVIYRLNPRFRLEASGGDDNSLDVFYSREYD
jgi:translocation and assembly module TamB